MDVTDEILSVFTGGRAEMTACLRTGLVVFTPADLQSTVHLLICLMNEFPCVKTCVIHLSILQLIVAALQICS